MVSNYVSFISVAEINYWDQCIELMYELLIWTEIKEHFAFQDLKYEVGIDA